YAAFRVVSGVVFAATLQVAGICQADGLFYLCVFGLFVVALAINFTLIAGYSSYVDGTPLWTAVRRGLAPLLPSELASALLAVGVAFLYVKFGLPTVAMLGVVVLVFQYLIGARLVSQHRADELALRANQLAGFQVALLSALLRTLDLRDRMTARHTAAAPPYS